MPENYKSLPNFNTALIIYLYYKNTTDKFRYAVKSIFGML